MTVNGLFRPFALIDGRAAAIWRLTAGKVEIDSFAALAPCHERALQAEGRDVLRYLGLPAQL